jgi:hypothetical protein
LGRCTPGTKPEFQEIKKPCFVPLRREDFRTRSSYLYKFTFDNHRLLHQSTGGFIKDKLVGLRPDIALLYPTQLNDTAVMLKALRPKKVFVHHFDEWRAAFSEGIPESNARRAQRFTRDVNAIDECIKSSSPNSLSLPP